MSDLMLILNRLDTSLTNIRSKVNSGIHGPYDNMSVNSICRDINELSFEVRDRNRSVYENLQMIKSNLFTNVNMINLYTLGMLCGILSSFDFQSSEQKEWDYIHPTIKKLTIKKFEIEDYAGAVQSALIEICSIVREHREKIGAKEIPSDKDMMLNTFSTEKYITFTDSSNTSLKNIQEGYERLFAGAIQAWRNPNAHKNNKLEKEDAMRKLMLASDLMYKLEEALKRTDSSGGE